MRAITKGSEPASLTTHRLGVHCDYENYPDKDALRVVLVKEQRGLCCYCMSRIDASGTTMKIEHWQCQNATKRDLEHWNLLAACLGGQGQPLQLQHCDTRKGDQDLKFNPADPAHGIEQRIRFKMDGTISSSDADFDGQLNHVLNLNLQLLKNRRKGVIDGLVIWLRMYKSKHRRGPDNATLQRQRVKWLPANSALQAYALVAVWWIDQRLPRVPNE